jgi:hypothetical protein
MIFDRGERVDSNTDEAPGYVIPEQVYLREVNGQMVLLNLETEEYYGLDEVGALIVNRLVEHPMDDAIDLLLTDFEIDTETLRGDVDALVASLLLAGLLRENPGQ